MTVKELIEKLKEMPMDATVERMNIGYLANFEEVEEVEYNSEDNTISLM